MDGLSEQIGKHLGEPATKGALGKLEKRAKKKPAVPVHADPVAELRRLVQEHKALTRNSVALRHMSNDRKNRETGDVIPCRMPTDVQVEFNRVADITKARAKTIEAAMTKALKDVPIYAHFLSGVFGFGPVIAAYLVAMVDIHKCEKPSGLRKFCGLAVIDGRLERPTRGAKLGYVAELRTRLFQGFAAMWKNAAKKTPARPTGTTTKYLDVWRGYKHRMQHSDRVNDRKVSPKDGVVDGKIVNGQGKTVSARGFAHSTGWHKAADVLVEDLYIIWRTLEGLPVWPSYYAAKLGYEHGGKISVNAPKMLALDDALAIVGDVGPRATATPTEDVDFGDEEDDG